MHDAAARYFAEANRWETAVTEQFRASARRAWWVAGGACVLASACATALAMLLPLKRVEPFVVRVDNTTGIVDVVPSHSATAPLPDIVTRHLVTQYVTQRERYIPAIAESDYDQIGAFHSAAMNQEWAASWARTNSQSPLNRYADGSRLRVQVKSVAFLKHASGGPETLQVRFLTALQRGAGGGEEIAHYVVTLAAAYGPPSQDVRLRALNPLGFKVLEYRREPEVVAPATEVPAAMAAAAGTTP